MRPSFPHLIFAGGVAALVAIVAPQFVPGPADAEEAKETQVASLEQREPQRLGASGLPLPRYVSMKAERVNLRVGPGRDYPVSWLYLKEGLPMEIIQEYGHWRRVRDSEGSEGWVFHSLLSGERTAIAAPWLKGKTATIDMRDSADEASRITARLEPGVITRVAECSFGWCRAEADGREGFISQTDLWGVYPNEKF